MKMLAEADDDDFIDVGGQHTVVATGLTDTQTERAKLINVRLVYNGKMGNRGRSTLQMVARCCPVAVCYGAKEGDLLTYTACLLNCKTPSV